MKLLLSSPKKQDSYDMKTLYIHINELNVDVDDFKSCLDWIMSNQLFRPDLFNYDMLFTTDKYSHISKDNLSYILTFYRLANKHNIVLPPLAWASLIYYLIKNKQEVVLFEMRTWKIFDARFFIPFTQV